MANIGAFLITKENLLTMGYEGLCWLAFAFNIVALLIELIFFKETHSWNKAEIVD